MVHLHTILQQQTPQGMVRKLSVKLPEQSTLAVLLDTLKIELPVDALLLVVNGRVADLEQALCDGDEINLMPALSGGSEAF
ncbi:MAG: MoaD/ThiS family protein [Chloroflexota bacterium]